MRLRAVLATGLTLLGLDLVFLGVVAAPIYDRLLGPLKAPNVNAAAAGLFYAMYLGAVVIHAVLPAPDVRTAAKRGAGLGFVAYATYELTNLAVIAGWPAALVPVDVAWGVFLTASAAAVGRRAMGA